MQKAVVRSWNIEYSVGPVRLASWYFEDKRILALAINDQLSATANAGGQALALSV